MILNFSDSIKNKFPFVFKALLSIYILLMLSSCHNEKQTFTNKSHYSIEIGDTLEIYYSTNSCCRYCEPNTDKLKHLKYAGSKIVVEERKECEGCTTTHALMFVAKSKGIDTIKNRTVLASELCSDTIAGLATYIIEIR